MSRAARALPWVLSAILAAGYPLGFYLGFVSPWGSNSVWVRVQNASSSTLSEVEVINGRARIPLGEIRPRSGRAVRLPVLRGENGVCVSYVHLEQRRVVAVDEYVTHWTSGAMEALVMDDGTVTVTSITDYGAGAGRPPDGRRRTATLLSEHHVPRCD